MHTASASLANTTGATTVEPTESSAKEYLDYLQKIYHPENASPFTGKTIRDLIVQLDESLDKKEVLSEITASIKQVYGVLERLLPSNVRPSAEEFLNFIMEVIHKTTPPQSTTYGSLSSVKDGIF